MLPMHGEGDRDGERDGRTNRDRETNTEAETDTERQIDRQMQTERDTETKKYDRERKREVEREGGGPTFDSVRLSASGGFLLQKRRCIRMGCFVSQVPGAGVPSQRS